MGLDRVLIAGGGTGGHVYPGVVIARELKREYRRIDILYVGTKRGLEAKVVPKEGLKFITISAGGLVEVGFLKRILSLARLLRGLGQSLFLLRRYKPDVVVGMGGYVCSPIVLSAWAMRIPILIHEQNAIPGVANRFLSRFANQVAVSFPESKKYFPSGKVALTGNPVRREILQPQESQKAKDFELREGAKTILAFGGSKGAHTINVAFLEALKIIEKENPKLQAILITGPGEYSRIMERYHPGRIKVVILPYLDNIADALNLAQLVVCRAGATTIAELTARGIPAILIPFPYATGNHQEYNAQFLAKEGAALMIRERELNGERLAQTILNLLTDEEGLKKMSQKSKQLGRPEAAKEIVKLIGFLAQGEGVTDV